MPTTPIDPAAFPPPPQIIDIPEGEPSAGRSPLLKFTASYSPDLRTAWENGARKLNGFGGYTYCHLSIQEQVSAFRSKGAKLTFRAPWTEAINSAKTMPEEYRVFTALASASNPQIENPEGGLCPVFLLGSRRGHNNFGWSLFTKAYVERGYFTDPIAFDPEEMRHLRVSHDRIIMGMLVLMKAWAEAYGRKEWGDKSSPPDALLDSRGGRGIVTVGGYRMPGRAGNYVSNATIDYDPSVIPDTGDPLVNDAHGMRVPDELVLDLLKDFPELPLTEAEKEAKAKAKPDHRRDGGVKFGTIYRLRNEGDWNFSPSAFNTEANKALFRGVTETYWVY